MLEGMGGRAGGGRAGSGGRGGRCCDGAVGSGSCGGTECNNNAVIVGNDGSAFGGWGKGSCGKKQPSPTLELVEMGVGRNSGGNIA